MFQELHFVVDGDLLLKTELCGKSRFFIYMNVAKVSAIFRKRLKVNETIYIVNTEILAFCDILMVKM